MQNTIDTQQSTTEAEIMRLFRGAGDKLEAESAVLDAVIRNIVIQGQKVTSKAIIINLIAELESTEDVVQLDVLRSCLEIVVGRTCSQEEQA
ncbi:MULTISPECIES: biofilm development regulator YmgB/AriR family protein [Pantoea]|nr:MULTISPECIES: biofilm development regulator YmgB/AriR family protein [Pantoea]AER31138.1 regulatory protein AriR [Pantoea ananatis PA13]AMB73505.1 transcriptional regulator [Pantoea ananatis]ASN13674.1 transcriptional regulator [Pantoea ananatis]ASN17669.1 transcriptional regulator [Pantoea ananatis]AVG74526.1 transcriptional regulator [Pantoea ananatis]